MSNKNIQKEEFPFSVKIRDNVIKYRKWKVKDRNKYIAANRANDKAAIQEALVFDCLENPNIALSTAEIKYVLTQIRISTLGEKIEYDLECSNCHKEFELDVNLSDVVKPIEGEFSKIKANGVEIKLGEVKNKEYYDNLISECGTAEIKELMDLLMHISSYNGNDAFTLDDLIDEFNNMDADVAEEVFAQWNDVKFKIDTFANVQCPHCSYTERYIFDFVPGFFPASWMAE